MKNKVYKGNCPECQFEPKQGHSWECSKDKFIATTGEQRKEMNTAGYRKEAFGRGYKKGRKDVIEKHNKIIKLRLKYCQEQNGMPVCKNCGLDEGDLIR